MKRYTPDALLLFCLTTFLFFAGLFKDADAGTISGTMQMKDGAPMANGMAIFFDSSQGPPPVPGREFRPPDVTEHLDKEGSFNVKIKEGEYYFGAILWLKRDGPGPPRPGDSFFVTRDRTVVIPEDGSAELGVVAEGEIIKERN
jgi:hypothetical protein